MSKALVVLSGGQDSTTCLFWAKEHFDEVHAITFNYGQKHSREIKSAEQVAFIAGVESHTIVDVPDILKSRSPLLDKSVMLETYDNYEEMDSIIGDRVELTFVPMRNAFFLTVVSLVFLGNRSSCSLVNIATPSLRHPSFLILNGSGFVVTIFANEERILDISVKTKSNYQN